MRTPPNPVTVAVVGAGGGVDAEAALLCGAREVDAVEIDPGLVSLASRFNASRAYADPRVRVHIDDARSFFKKSNGGYDLLIFGFLDSQGLFSSMSNIRLDGFVYTEESLREAFKLLNDDGMMVISFATFGKEWVARKLVSLAQTATQISPLIYTDGSQIIICVPKGRLATRPDRVDHFQRINIDLSGPVTLPTDDWPYLYLYTRTIPDDYLLVIGTLMVLTAVLVATVCPTRLDRSHGHFFFLGAAFLLLETKGITDCSLFFGATWQVTTIVVSGILIMVFLANIVAMRLEGYSGFFYVPLFILLVVIYLIPTNRFLDVSFTWRLLWSLLAVPLPVFWAGLIFSTSFRNSESPSSLFGANLAGATLGGFCEYLGMLIGHRDLCLLIFLFYGASLSCKRK